MNNYRVIGIDLAKSKFHYAAVNEQNEVVAKAAIYRHDFFSRLSSLFAPNSRFAFEACGGSHYVAQQLQAQGHKVEILKPKDVKPHAKTRQKNDINDAIAICKAALDPELMRVRPKSKEEQETTYLHKARQNIIQQRIQRSNSLMTSLLEFGYLVDCGKSKFATKCKLYIDDALEKKFITNAIYAQMHLDCTEIEQLLGREKSLDKEIVQRNKQSKNAQLS
jgi:transposase